MLDNLAQLHTAIVGGLRAKLAGVPTVDAYPAIQRRVSLPAVLVELAEMEPGTDPGTGETALVGRIQARAIIDPNQANADLQVRELAARIAVAITHETWGLDISVAQLVQIGEDAFKPELDGYMVWVVEWTHEFHLGSHFEWQTFISTTHGGETIVADRPENLSAQASIAASSVLLGLYPETGEGRAEQYWPLSEGPPADWGEQKP